MSDSIIPSLKKMLVDKAERFEEIIKNPKQGQNKKGASQSAQSAAGQIAWNNADELEEFIKKVQEAANDIMNENRRLRKLHLSIIEQVIILFDIDLVKSKHLWKEKVDVKRRLCGFYDEKCVRKVFYLLLSASFLLGNKKNY